MFGFIRHAYRVAVSIRREQKKRETRSGEWPRVEKEHLHEHPTCAACGGKKRLQVHHERPFHMDPKLELDPRNLITLCMAKHECHLRIGHGGSFHYYNPHVVIDSGIILGYPDRRAAMEARAKKNRVLNEPGARALGPA